MGSDLRLIFAEGLSFKTTVSLITGLAIAYVFLSFITSYRRLAHIKGPPAAAWTNLWWINAALSRKSHIYLHEACKKYGSLVRIAPNLLVTSDAELVRRINAVRSPYSRSDWNKAFRFDADRENLFSQTDKEKHARMRQKMTLGYSGKENAALEPEMDAVILTLVDLLKAKYVSKGADIRPVDLGEKIQFLTLDVITALALGKSFGFLEDVDKYEYIKTMESSVPIMNFMSAVPMLSRLIRIPAVQRLILPSVKDRIGLGKVKAIARDLIAARLADQNRDKSRNDMLESFIRAGLEPGELLDEALLQILAGSDTTANILRSAFIHITANPSIYRRLQDEAVAANIPLNRVISDTEAGKLPYLNACIKETLRYNPVNTGIGPKTVGPAGDSFEGTYLPPFTEIGVCAWAVYRHNPAYGPDCAFFRPERWLDSTPEQLARMDKEHELVFMYGAFKCMGERIARIELKKVLFELLRRFDFAFVDPMRVLEREECYGLMIQRGLWMRIIERRGGDEK